MVLFSNEDLNHGPKRYNVKMSSQKPLPEKAVCNNDICLHTLTTATLCNDMAELIMQRAKEKPKNSS